MKENLKNGRKTRKQFVLEATRENRKEANG